MSSRLGRRTSSPSSSTPCSIAHVVSACRACVGESVRRDETLVGRGQHEAGQLGHGTAPSRRKRISTPGDGAERAGRALGDDQAVAQHDHAIGERRRLVQVVRGQEHGRAGRGELADRLPRAAARLGIEAGGRLVEEEQLGRARERERQVEPTALAAGEGAHAPVGVVREPDALEQLGRVAGPRVVAGVQLDRLARAQVRVRGSALEDDADALAQRPAAAAGIEAEHLGPAAVLRAVALEDLDRGRLARAVRAEQRHDLARLDPEGDSSQRVARAVALAELVDLDARLHDRSGYADAPVQEGDRAKPRSRQAP